MQTTIRLAPAHNPDQIAGLAYGLWEQAGRPAGRDQEFWFKAEQQLAGTAKPAAVSIGQARPNSSPDTSPTAFELKSQPKTDDAGKTATIAATQLAVTRQKRTAVAARAC